MLDLVILARSEGAVGPAIRSLMDTRIASVPSRRMAVGGVKVTFLSNRMQAWEKVESEGPRIQRRENIFFFSDLGM